MSVTFTKLFSSITASTIWAARDQTRIVWITMLAMADQHGRVWASIPGLANIARVSIEACEQALDDLQSPDKYSRTKDYEGRRIEPIDGGWRLLNHGKYRAVRDEESIKESKRRYINAKRAAERASTVDDVEKCRTDVEKCRTTISTVDRSRHNTEAEAEAEADTKEKNTSRAKALLPPDGVSPSVWQDFLKHRKAKKAPVTETSLAGIKREADKAGWSLEDALRECCTRGWQSFKADWVECVPAVKPDKDPAIAKIERDAARAAPMPAAIREQISKLKGVVL